MFDENNLQILFMSVDNEKGINMYYISFDIGGTMVKYALLDKVGHILKRNQFPTMHSSKTDFYDSLIDIIKQFESDYQINGIGISMPGVIDPSTGKSIMAGALYKLYGENIKKYLENEISYPVYIENDANCALLAEKFRGNARNESNVLLLTIGTGIGGAILVEDSLVHGQGFKAGEFGMMRIDTSRHPNTTLHELASTSALIQFYKEAFNIPEDVGIDGKIIFEKMAKDKMVKEIVNQWLHYLVTGIFNIAVTMNPGKILIGGGISENPKLLPLVLEKIEENEHWNDFKTPIDTCKFKNNSGLIGALYNVLQQESN